MTSNTDQSVKAYIGLGSNIEQPYTQIKSAMLALNELPKTKVLADSGYFKSQPMGPKDQPDFINAVVELGTMLSASQLLTHCQNIEQQQGRVKKRHWGERTIDLDILLYADVEMKTDKLVIPHPGIGQRDFVYLPLLKLNSEIRIPGLGVLKYIVPLSNQLENNQVENKQLVNNQLETNQFSDSLLSKMDKDTNTEFDCRYVGKIE